MLYLLYGLFIGFSIGMTIGPIAILCLQRSLIGGIKLGLATGLGASLAHFVFGSIAAFSWHYIHEVFKVIEPYIQFIGSCIIIVLALYIGYRPISFQPNKRNIDMLATPWTALISTFFINLSNPITIASYAGFISVLNLSFDSIHKAILFVFGLFAGNFLFWILLSTIGVYVGSKINRTYLNYMNNLAAFCLGCLGAFGIIMATLKMIR